MQRWIWKKYLIAVLGLCITGIVTGCTHIAGTVVWEDTNQPAAGALISVGNPGGDFTSDSHTTDVHGAFSFNIDPLDTDDIWVWSGHGDPDENAIHIDPGQVNDHMLIEIPSQ